MQYDNTNKGVLFRNQSKAEGDKKPDYTGKLKVAGKDFALAGWLKESKTGTKFLSLSLSEPKPKQTSDEL